MNKAATIFSHSNDDANNMKYRVLIWHTCKKLPKEFTDMLFKEYVNIHGSDKVQEFIDFEKNPFSKVISALNGLNMMILNRDRVIWIGSDNFRQS